MEVRRWSDVGRGPQSKQHERPGEAEKVKETDSPLAAPEEASTGNTLTAAP